MLTLLPERYDDATSAVEYGGALEYECGFTRLCRMLITISRPESVPATGCDLGNIYLRRDDHQLPHPDGYKDH
jgi:hypothetical protein